MAQLVSDQNEVNRRCFCRLLLVGVFAIALSTMMSLFFSKPLPRCAMTSCCGFWPETRVRPSLKRQNENPGRATRHDRRPRIFPWRSPRHLLFADAITSVRFSSGVFLALVFAFSCAQLVFLPPRIGTYPQTQERSLFNPEPAIGLWRFWALVRPAEACARDGPMPSTGHEAWALGRGFRFCLGFRPSSSLTLARPVAKRDAMRATGPEGRLRIAVDMRPIGFAFDAHRAHGDVWGGQGPSQAASGMTGGRHAGHQPGSGRWAK